MPMITNADMFTAAEMTQAVNKLPNIPFKFSPLFQQDSVRTTSVAIDYKQGKIILVSDSPRGVLPEAKSTDTKRSIKHIETCHLVAVDTVRPEDLQNERGFGSEQPETAASVVNDKIIELKNNVEMTKEFHRLGAIKGQIYDADGTSLLYDLYDFFGISKKAMILTFPTKDEQLNPIMAKVLEAKRHVEAGVGGLPLLRIEAVCGADFYDKLTGHKLVRDYFQDWLARQADFGLNDYRRRGFTYGNMTFFEASEVVGGRTMVEATKCHVYPVGHQVFQEYYAPADWMSTVNTKGLPFYAQMIPIEGDRGFKVEVQSNPLTICNFPEALVELTAA